MTPLARAAALVLLAAPAFASEDRGGWGPPVGTVIPAASLADQSGAMRTFDGLMEQRGLLIFFNRSADW